MDRLEFGDAEDYRSAARSICSGEGVPERGNLPFFRAPGLPYFIAATTACRTDSAIGWTKITLAAVDSMTVALLLLVARRFANSEKLAVAVSAAAALNPFFIVQVTDLRSEPLTMALLVLSLVLLLSTRDRARTLSLLLSGAVLGAAALVRPPTLVATLAWALFLWVDSGTLPARVRLGRVLMLVLGLLGALAPWTVRNWIRFEELIVINDAAGYNFWRSTRPELDAILRTSEPREFQRGAELLEGEVTRTAVAEADSVTATPRERERWFWNRGLEQIGNDPRAWSRLLLRNVGDFWRPWLDPIAYGRTLAAGSAVFLLVLFLLAGIGLASCFRRDHALFVLASAQLLVVTLAHSPFQAIMRYRLPLAEPLLIVLAALGASALFLRGLTRRTRAGYS